MVSSDSEFPAPSSAATAISRQICAILRAKAEAGGGWLSFENYMQTVLYEPGLGYYSAGAEKIGRSGDFITAPQISEFLARAIADMIRTSGRLARDMTILELGAGTGRLADQLLTALVEAGHKDFRYKILETSGDLRERQATTLRRHGDRIEWIDRLGQRSLSGVVIANEVLDALPVQRFVIRAGRPAPLGVTPSDGAFAWREGESDAELESLVRQLEGRLGRTLPDGYVSEICPLLEPWLQSIASALTDGALLLIDYGLVGRDYYHEQRRSGTLTCHYRHRRHGDPFLHPGLQDISAWVDFTACAAAAAQAGLRIDGFTTQAAFIVATLGAADPSLLEGLSPEALAGLKTLVLPGEMGEAFKVLLATKNCDAFSLPGRDLRSRL